VATKYQIFVSSTYQDLKAERDQVIRAVLEMGHIPVGMEMFSAADEQQWQIISRHIDESDYYAVIIAHRYGSVTGGISYTRKEYEYAVSKGIPALGFIIDNSAPWPADRVDKADEEKKLLDDFKGLVKQKLVSFWNSADDLYGKFSVALMKAITANPREGWVRASIAVSPQVTAEITRLSAENAQLRTALAAAERESEADREAELSKTNARLKDLSNKFSYRYMYGDTSWQPSDSAPNDILFDLLAPSLLTEASIKGVAGYLALSLRKDRARQVDTVAHNQVQELFADWSALDLVMPSERKRSLKDTEEYWTLTSFGRDLHKWMRRRELLSDTARNLDDAPTVTAVEATAAEEEKPKKATAKKTTAKTAKKTTAKKTTAKKTTAKKTTA